MKKLILTIMASLLLLSCGNAKQGKITLAVTTSKLVRVDKSEAVKDITGEKTDFTVSGKEKRQTIRGFGGAFNEQGWDALLSLPDKDRDAVVRYIFSPEEANLSWGRIPIGASDYAMDRYTLAPVADDFEMSQFSIARDEKLLIPYVKAALAVRPDLKLWASAWTPPIWMKDNNDYEGGRFIDDGRYYKAYALYLEKFVEGYAKDGITVSAVAVQNEPTVVTGYPNGGWTPKQFLTFIRDYGGPLFAANKVPAKIWLATFNEGRYETFVKTVLDDPKAKKYVDAVGLQWDGDKQIPSIKKYHPEVPIIQTETDCGNWTWKPGFDKNHASNDFTYAAYTWGRIRDYLSAGAEAYMLWNIVLDQDGKNIDKKLPWPQNSGIVIDKASGMVTYTPMFRAFEHFSRYVPIGSTLLATSGTQKDLVAFRTPSGATVVELMNGLKETKRITGNVAGKRISIELPPESFATLTME
jgi:glucosylceramidase